MPAIRRRDEPRDEARRQSPSYQPRSVVRPVALAVVPTRDPLSSRNGRRTAGYLVATTRVARRSPRRTVANVPRSRDRRPRSRQAKSPDLLPRAADPPKVDRSRPASWRAAPGRAPLRARPSLPASSPPCAPSPPQARRSRRARAPRTPCDHSPTVHQSRVAQQFSCTRRDDRGCTDDPRSPSAGDEPRTP